MPTEQIEVLSTAIDALQGVLDRLDGAELGLRAAPFIDHGMHLLKAERIALNSASD